MTSINPIHPLLPSKSGSQIQWDDLTNNQLSLALASSVKQSSAPILIVTPDVLTASRLEEELNFFAPDCPITQFPDWETLPYDNFSPHQNIVSHRLETLYGLSQLKQGIVLVALPTLMQRIAPLDYLQAYTFLLNKGDTLVLDTLRKRLEQSGYRCVNQVLEHGEFAVRGSILDLFPMGSQQPYRIDLLDNEIDSIRSFDTDTQRTIDKIDAVRLLPAHEFPLTETAITLFRQNWRSRFSGNPTQCPIYQDISQKQCSPGIEYYLPLFFEKTAVLFDYLPNNSLLFLVGDLYQSANIFWDEIKERYEQRRYDISRPLLAPADFFLPVADLFQKIGSFSRVQIPLKISASLPELSIQYKGNASPRPLELLENFLENTDDRILFCAESTGRREVLLELLKNSQLRPTLCSSWPEFLAGHERYNICVVSLEQGLQLQDPPITLIAESQLFGQRVAQQRRRRSKGPDVDAAIRNLAELKIGSPVVHIDHGIGRYNGLEVLKIGEIEGEYLSLEYAGSTKLYVPVASLHLISRYSGMDPEQVPLNRLGTEQWQKTKRKVAEQIRDVAAELLEIHAKRAARKGFAFDNPATDYLAFSSSFPFEVTPDQEQAIERVIEDMTSSQPMDRLICGDVGFGKTEVAMRAAFIAVQNNKQVAILVPTTLLAQQHYQNFKDRFSDWPINIQVISRFQSSKEQKNIIQQLQEGKVDILIGTHKLLQPSIQFPKLGLVVIDEEHRFGVRQKERLRSLRAEVDVLTLTATPIPRTLNMTLAGMRDLSIIATPPARRLSIKTFLREHTKALVREAVLREILRGGQCYYLHNDISTIEKTAHDLNDLVPEARVAIAHGQMHERDLERVMADFYHHRNHILVCTTIIETGIDVPTANTIIIDRADKFGLAQLHQLRGRVGRSHHQAYAYFLIPPEKSLAGDALKRLEAIASLEDLGAGFTLATHDLEIRGAGELLGEEQSGHVQEIGFTLYMELLDRAVKALKSGKIPDLDLSLESGTEIDLQIPALIPDKYIMDVNVRLMLYKRIASISSAEALQDLQVEMVDRFGLLPEQTKNLFKITELKLKATPLGIRKIDAHAKGGRIDFKKQAHINPDAIIRLISTEPRRYKLEGPERLKFFWECETADARVKNIDELLGKMVF